MRLVRPKYSIILLLVAAWAAPTASGADDAGVVPSDARGLPLNLDFEAGSLKDWTAEGPAFAGSLVEGDAVAKRRSDMKSGHAGKFWVGSYEKGGDVPHGTLTSAPFPVAKPFASFLVGGGDFPETRVELVLRDGGRVIAKASGEKNEGMTRVAFDLTPHLGREIFIRLVDEHSGGWGHVNFDDFRLHDTKPAVPARKAPDAFAHAGLPPAESAAAMTVPEGFKVTLFAGEPDVHQPIGFAIDDRGRLWVAEDYSYPVRVPEDQARDQILIFEDTDNDGKFDTRKVFADKLNLVSGIELGFGGVFVGAAPNLLFIPDKDGDDRPDGPPEILLDGWGYEDTHETLNSFAWGPDGWLYGCHGVFTHSRVGKPGTPDAERTPINAGIWRYHPTRREFEVFAHGTSNPWGIAFDPHGQAVETACVIPHLYHMIQGGRYERQAGPHFNPYTYDDIKTIADHRHYLGGNPHAGNGVSGDAGGGHAHAGAMIYQGGSWPAPYAGSLFMNNIHGARINRDVLTPRGSGFVGSHAPDFLLTNDAWSQIISLKYGPDGQVYFIDWYDRQQCHHKDLNIHDRSNGRIYKVSYEPDGKKPTRPIADVAKLTDDELMNLVSAPNEWYAAHARRVLMERAQGGKQLDHKRLRWAFVDINNYALNKEVERLRALWAFHAIGKIDEPDWGWGDPSPYVRAWKIQLIFEQRVVNPSRWDNLVSLAKSDLSPVVRLALASAMQRRLEFPTDRHREADAKRWDVIAALADHAEDADDHNLPLMVWYAAEPLAAQDPSRALKLAAGSKLPTLLPFMVRRVAAIGTPESLALLIDAIGQAPTAEARRTILAGVVEALKGRRTVDRPANWDEIYAKLVEDKDPEVRSRATSLAVSFGDASAMEQMRTVLVDASADLPRRRDALASLLKAKDAKLAPALRALLAEPALRGEALRGLAAADDPATPAAILRIYPTLPPNERRDALNTLAARSNSARALLAAVASGTVGRAELSADLLRQVRNLKDPEIDAEVGRVWGAVRETSQDRAKMIADARKRFAAKPAKAPDPILGRAVFAKTCQQCHNLFGTGGAVGPELTGSNRADLDYVLANVYDPSALIGKDYLAHVVATTDGRILTGIVRAEDKDALTLVTANETVILPKNEVEDRKPSEASMMPEGLWDPLDDHEIRSLLAYLASPAQVPMLATPENAAGFFNGRDLAGWDGDPTLWSVKDGEIVGRTEKGIGHNSFLRSDLAAADFRLTLDIKLVGDQGNSGIQFRSEPLPRGEMKGYQADAGPGWWGKLYEEEGRGILREPSGPVALNSGDWNTYEILAVGPKIETRINGQVAITIEDPAGARRGIFGLQLHAGGPTEVRFRNLKLELNPRP
ncbi:PVC-type heme-binding CxxCH protein [Tundrisphaera sp. TA3]|uniref:PVC-type heme-binding CxxCH protein n=1 Tax=Tundrisphaera sp. TA3 TaxID=3435775 RepID=UPI003EB7E3B8